MLKMSPILDNMVLLEKARKNFIKIKWCKHLKDKQHARPIENWERPRIILLDESIYILK